MKLLTLHIFVFAACVNLYAQERAAMFNFSVHNHPNKMAAIQLDFNASSYDSKPTYQYELGWRRPLKGENWFTELFISYRHSAATMAGDGRTLYSPTPDYQWYVDAYIEENIKLYMPGVKFAVTKRWFLKSENTALWMTIGVAEYGIMYKSEREISPTGVHNKPFIESNDLRLKELSFGIYMRPMLEFNLSKTPTPWKYYTFAEIDYFSKYRGFSSPSRYVGLGFGTSYTIE